MPVPSPRQRLIVALSAFLLTGATLAVLQSKSGTPLLLPERFVPGAGWPLGVLLAVYAAWLVHRMAEARTASRWRRRAWLLFSVVFFTQLAVGLAGEQRFLMTGRLHLPVPALIVAGPIYRGSGLFMPILFLSTVVLVGPAWCSHLCYVGAWDNAAAAARRRPLRLPAWTRGLRWALSLLVVLVALALRLSGASATLALALGLAFGLAGVALMLLASRGQGTMVHCTVYCPIGLAANLLGKLSPFRVRIGPACTDCAACTPACRYGALEPEHVARRRPGLGCTLCGDCLDRCRDGQLSYRFAGRGGGGATVRCAFLVLAVSLHAIFLGVARI